jgi:ribosomal protein S18 acetylase RimI-like enzyme
MSSLPHIHEIPTTSYAHLSNLLLPHLATSLYAIRILQWPYNPPSATFFTSFPLTDPTTNEPISTLPRVFCFARFDREAFRGVGLYIHSSLEMSSDLRMTSDEAEEGTRQLLALCHALHMHNRPKGSENTSPQDTHFAGHLHSSLAHLLQQHAIIPADTALNGSDAGPYNKYVYSFTPRGSLPSLPAGLEYSTITPADYALVMSQNKLIRDIRTFKDCPTAAVRFAGNSSCAGKVPAAADAQTKKGDLVAWTFMTGYGSVRSLHTMPSFRRLGLARAVVLKLLEDEWPADFTSGDGRAVSNRERVFHADIDPKNEASIRTFQALGPCLGVSPCYWVGVDLGRAGDAMGMLEGE